MGINRMMTILVAFSIVFISGSDALTVGLGNGTETNCSYSNMSIHSIQGAGHKSPVAGCYVSGIRGIVTLNTSSGFYIQDLQPDNDKSTSEGVLIYTKSPPRNVKKGDLANVSGIVSEYQPDIKGLSLTEIINSTYATTQVNSSLVPVLIGVGGLIPPETVIEDDAFGDIATNNTFDPDTDGIDFYESLEGMLVEINDAMVIGPATPAKNRRAVVFVLGDNGSQASIRTPRGGIILRPGDYNPERIALDFFADSSEPINVGDRITGPIVGVMDYSKGNYRIVVDKSTPLKVTHGSSNKGTIADEITIATFNVKDLSPNSGMNKFKMLAKQIVENLGSPDVIALEEIMGNVNATDGSDIFETLNLLTQGIKTSSNGKVQYSNISIPDKTSDRNIAILYRTDRGLSFNGLSTGNPTADVMVISGPHISPNPGWIYPKNAAFTKSRAPLAAEFTFNGQSLFVIANHLKSKLEDDPLYAEYQPPRRLTENQRHKQAQIVHDFVEEILNVDPKANVIVLGDLNDFQFSETLDILKGNDLFNPLENLPIAEQYTYNFEGNSQALDRILISKNLLNMSPEFNVSRINSDFGNQTSDHDPVSLRINFP